MVRAISLVTLLAVATLAFAQTAEQKAAVEKEKRELVRLKKNYDTAKRAFGTAKNNPQRKKAYIEATMAYGTSMMNTVTLRPQEKYPGALRLFREVLKVEPKHPGAKKNIDLIEGIYRSLGRPVPK